MAHGRPILVAGYVLLAAGLAQAQIDPEPRELVQLGHNQPLQGKAPLSGYAFYYGNIPHWHRTNLTLRLAIAPVYLDSELGVAGVLGPNTDLGFGMAGGGFADTYSEIRRGKYLQRESFTGHGGGLSASLYHLFNPGDRIPLNAVVHVSGHYATYSEDSKTDRAFELPEDQLSTRVRAGLRWGGREPLMMPDLAMELSAWYEAEVRAGSSSYGFANDRRVRPDAHLFWGRAMLTYTLPESKHSFTVSLTAGTSVHPDRFSAYRLGGVLPLVSEFPLTLPGYYFQELSARSFGLLAGDYAVPLDSRQRLSVAASAAVAVVDYVEGLEQPGRWHSGVGAGVIYRSPTDSWHMLMGYGYGIEAIRSGHRGAHSIGFLVQFDLGRNRNPLFNPGENAARSRGLQRLFQIFR